MANQEQLSDPRDVGFTEASGMEIAEIFRERGVNDAFAEAEQDGAVRVALRFNDLGICPDRKLGTRPTYGFVPRENRGADAQLLITPFQIQGANPYHDVWRAVFTYELTNPRRQFARDWLVNKTLGHCVSLETINEVPVQPNEDSGPALRLITGQIVLQEGSSYLSFLRKYDAEFVEQFSDVQGFIDDTRAFVGGRSMQVSSRDPGRFSHPVVPSTR